MSLETPLIMPSLLCTLGTSWAVVPEAFLLGNGAALYESIVIITTDSDLTRKSLQQATEWFLEYHPSVSVRALAIGGLADLASSDDHRHFEEGLYRAYFSLLGEKRPIHVCLAGGFKTMSASAQEAAGLLGCESLFHILAEPEVIEIPGGRPLRKFPETHQEIELAIAQDRVRMIALGSRAGWPTIQELASSAACLPPTGEAFHLSDFTLTTSIHRRLEAANRLAASEGELATLPFPQIARWAPGERDWLSQPLDAATDAAWLLALPKVELHCHLGGFATHGDLLDQVRAAADHPDRLPPLSAPPLPDGWPLPETPVRLTDYMELGHANGSALLKDAGCLRKQCELLYAHFIAQNIVHAEVRCSPANYASPDRSPWTVLEEIKRTFDRCRVAATVPVAEPVAASFQLAGSRQFHPFEKDADYHQTWRDLPHRHQSGATAFVTFRLADSLPAARLKTWHREQVEFLAAHPKPWDEQTWKTYRRNFPQRLEEWLDEPHGECLLRQPAIAAELESALRHFDGDRYVLDAFVIMPNHVHVLVKPLPGHDLEEILHSWKSYTAHRINKQLGRTGQFWEHESFDHLLRSAKQLERLREYIRENPKKAGLADGFIVGRGLGLVMGEKETLGPPRGTPGGTDSASRRLAATHVNLIVIATRRDRGDYRTAIGRHLSLAVTAAEHWANQPGCRIVGVDLAGFEDPTTRAHYFREDFTAAHRSGLGITIHAGENDDAEGIWSAILDLNTRRLGHALHLADSSTLLKTVADRRIGVEMCPFANFQIKGFSLDGLWGEPSRGTPDATVPSSQRLDATVPSSQRLDVTVSSSQRLEATYPLLDYLQAGVPVTVNTDNIGISAASLTENFLLLPRLCPGITRLHILQLLRHSIDQAFLSAAGKAALLAHPIPHSSPSA